MERRTSRPFVSRRSPPAASSQPASSQPDPADISEPSRSMASRSMARSNASTLHVDAHASRTQRKVAPPPPSPPPWHPRDARRWAARERASSSCEEFRTEARARAGCHSCPVPMLRARPAGVRVHRTTGAAPRRRFRHLACASRDSGPDWCRRSTARPHEGASASVSSSCRATRRRVSCSPLPRRPVPHGPPRRADRARGARGGSCAPGAGWLARPRPPSQAAASGRSRRSAIAPGVLICHREEALCGVNIEYAVKDRIAPYACFCGC